MSSKVPTSDNNVYVAEELIVEITTKLPVKSLMRFQCMSKSFKTLTTKQNFISKHFSNSILATKNKPSFLAIHHINNFLMTLVCEEQADEQPVPQLQINDLTPNLPFPEDQDLLDTIMAHGPANGIICLEVSATTHPDRLILWNPATRETKLVPLPLSVECPTWEYCDVVHGFGFDSETNDYKIVNILMGHQVDEESDTQAYAQVYSLRNNSWKMIDVNMVGIEAINNSIYCSILNNSIYHWISKSDSVDSIFCIDMRTEEFRTMNLGPHTTQVGSIDGRIVDANVAVVKGLLAYIKDYKLDSSVGACVEVWTMNEYGNEESWTRMIVIGPFRGNWRFGGFWKEDGDEVVLTVAPSERAFTLYNIDTRRLLRVIPVKVGSMSHLFKHVESIVPLSYPV